MRLFFPMLMGLSLLGACTVPAREVDPQPQQALPSEEAPPSPPPVDAPTLPPENTHLPPSPTSESLRVMARQNLAELVALWQLRLGGAPILDLAFSPDSSLLAAAADDSRVHVFRASDGVEQLSLEGHSGRVNSVVFSPDGTLLASGGVDHKIILWQVSDGAKLAELQAHDSYVNALDFSPDGNLLVSGGEDRDVIIWQLSDNSVLHRFEDAKLSVGDVHFSPDGRLVASAGGEVSVYVWDVASGALHHISTGNSTVSSIAYSPDGTMLVGGSWAWQTENGVISDPMAGLTFWDSENGDKLDIHTLLTIGLDLSFFPDGSILVAGNADDYALNFWDASNGDLLHQLISPAWRHWAIAVSPDGVYIASGGGNGELVLWGLP